MISRDTPRITKALNAPSHGTWTKTRYPFRLYCCSNSVLIFDCNFVSFYRRVRCVRDSISELLVSSCSVWVEAGRLRAWLVARLEVAAALTVRTGTAAAAPTPTCLPFFRCATPLYSYPLPMPHLTTQNYLLCKYRLLYTSRMLYYASRYTCESRKTKQMVRVYCLLITLFKQSSGKR